MGFGAMVIKTGNNANSQVFQSLYFSRGYGAGKVVVMVMGSGRQVTFRYGSLLGSDDLVEGPHLVGQPLLLGLLLAPLGLDVNWFGG